MTRPDDGVLRAVGVYLAALAAILMLRPILPVDETRYLAVAWEMRRDGTWLVPRLNGEIYGHKPPLLFWLINLVWGVTGTDGLLAEVMPRLVSPAFMAGAIWGTGRLAREIWPHQPDRPVRAALIAATSLVTMVFGTATMFDAMLVAATVMGLTALWRMAQRPGLGPVALLGAALALGAYGKGPVILFHLSPVALLMPLWAPGTTRPRYARWLARTGLALLIGLGLVALWLVPALVLGGAEYREEVLWRQSAGRMVESFAHRRPWWFFVAALPLLLWPWGWSPARLRALAPRAVRADAGARMVAVQAAAALLAFSAISGKQLHYLLPELPAAALLLSAAGPERSRRWLVVAALPVLVLIGVGVAALAGRVSFGAEVDLPPTPGLVAASIGLVALAGTVAVRSGRGGEAGWGLLAPLAVVILLVLAQPLVWQAQDPRPMGRELAAREADGLALTGSGYHGEFTWAGRLSAPIEVLPDAEALSAWAEAHPSGAILTLEADLPYPVILHRPFRGGWATLYAAPAGAAP